MISLAYKKFCSALCNVCSKALNVRSKALNVRSKALNVRSKALNVRSKPPNGLFIVVQEQIHNKQETISMLFK